MKKILITFGGGRAAIGIAQALKDSADPPRITVTDSEKYALQRAVADERFLSPRGDHPKYFPFLKRIVERVGAEMVWPVHESEIPVLAQRSGEIGARTFLPDAETLKIGQDKLESYKRFSANGVPVPETVMIHDRGDLRAAFDSLGPHLWIRLTSGAGGKGALPVTDYDRALRWIEFHKGWGHFAAARNISAGRWASESIWNQGELIAIQGRHNLMSDLSGLTPSGITGFTRAKYWRSDPELDEIAIRAVKAISPSPNGIFGVDLVSDEDRNLYVTEVNVGRFSSAGFSHYRTVQINPVHTVVQLAFGEDLPFDPPLMNPFPQDELAITGYGHEAVYVNEKVVEQQMAEFDRAMAEL